MKKSSGKWMYTAKHDPTKKHGRKKHSKSLSPKKASTHKRRRRGGMMKVVYLKTYFQESAKTQYGITARGQSATPVWITPKFCGGRKTTTAVPGI